MGTVGQGCTLRSSLKNGHKAFRDVANYQVVPWHSREWMKQEVNGPVTIFDIVISS